MKIKGIVKKLSPVLVNRSSGSITFSLSRRFFLFTMMNRLSRALDDDKYLNFITLLKNYKVLGNFLYGTLREFYRDRNKSYFKNFFLEKNLYELVKADLEWLYPDYKDIKMTLTKRGVIIYDNYKENSFNVLLLTIHNGTWLPKDLGQRLYISDSFRYKEEDVDSHRLYSKLVLDKGGIWIDNKLSRFGCDLNRSIDKCIYKDFQESKIGRIWKGELSGDEIEEIHNSYNEFYFTLGKLVDTHRFNIIFDAHSMRDAEDRPDISFGIKYSPLFYQPIIRSMQRKLVSLGYKSVKLNQPFKGGWILQWLASKFPDVFTFSMEVNKKLYMTPNRKRSLKRQTKQLSEDIAKIFDIEVESDETSEHSPQHKGQAA